MAKHLVFYTSKPCWWCGSRLAVTGSRKIVDLCGNELEVHGDCYDYARAEITPLTAHPRLWPFLDPG